MHNVFDRSENYLRSNMFKENHMVVSYTNLSNNGIKPLFQTLLPYFWKMSIIGRNNNLIHIYTCHKFWIVEDE